MHPVNGSGILKCWQKLAADSCLTQKGLEVITTLLGQSWRCLVDQQYSNLKAKYVINKQSAGQW